MKDKITVLVVNHNQPEMTNKVIDDLLNQSFIPEIVVLNNGCTPDGRIKHRETDNPTVFTNKKNVNLNTVWNSFELFTKNEYLCFLNNDVRIPRNFIKDTIEVLDKEQNVGIAIHATNNMNYIKPTDLDYTVLQNQPACQGWDFTIRKSIYPTISKNLRIFGGDDYVFAKVVKDGWKIAFITSSPILHLKEQTRKIVDGIKDIQSSDYRNLMEILKNEGLRVVPNTINVGLCGKHCTKEMENAWKGEPTAENILR